MTAKEYFELDINNRNNIEPSPWSKPKYKCHKCDGGMCKNLILVFFSHPPKYEYQCYKCNHKEYHSM